MASISFGRRAGASKTWPASTTRSRPWRSTAFGKAHDQGKADGTRRDPSGIPPGGVAGKGDGFTGLEDVNNTPDDLSDDVFRGVAAEGDMTYGQDTVVANQVRLGVRRVDPTQNGFPPGQQDIPRGD